MRQDIASEGPTTNLQTSLPLCKRNSWAAIKRRSLHSPI